MKRIKLILGLIIIVGIIALPIQCQAASRYVPKAAEWLAVFINSQILGSGLDDMRIQAQVVNDNEIAIRTFYNSLVFTQADAKPIVDTAVDFGNKYINSRKFNIRITTEYNPLRVTGNRAEDLRELLLKTSQ